ncbi:MAG: hypothetical protein HRU11_14845 [Parvularculaceae bacterium]|nr:hypothetical protein [Parvularculaceae bacterium]
MLKQIFCVGLLALASSLVTTAHAQRLQNPATLMPNFNLTTVEATLVDLGATVERLNLGSDPTIGVTMPSGAKLLMVPIACDTATNICTGLSVRALFREGGSNAVSVNRFNQAGTPAKVVLQGERPVMYELLVNEYGMARGNFDVYVRLFERSMSQYITFMNSGSSDIRKSASLRSSISLAQETSHLGTLPLEFHQHPNGFMSLGNVPDAYITDLN